MSNWKLGGGGVEILPACEKNNFKLKNSYKTQSVDTKIEVRHSYEYIGIKIVKLITVIHY